MKQKALSPPLLRTRATYGKGQAPAPRGRVAIHIYTMFAARINYSAKQYQGVKIPYWGSNDLRNGCDTVSERGNRNAILGISV